MVPIYTVYLILTQLQQTDKKNTTATVNIHTFPIKDKWGDALNN